MTAILDSGGLTVLISRRRAVAELVERDLWPPIVPAVVLTESLTGDHRRDFHANRLLRRCRVQPTTEIIARHAAALRTSASRQGISAADAIVVATADHAGGGVVLTSDLHDLRALAENTIHEVRVEQS